MSNRNGTKAGQVHVLLVDEHTALREAIGQSLEPASPSAVTIEAA
jgi:hypothetical protein